MSFNVAFMQSSHQNEVVKKMTIDKKILKIILGRTFYLHFVYRFMNVI